MQGQRVGGAESRVLGESLSSWGLLAPLRVASRASVVRNETSAQSEAEQRALDSWTCVRRWKPRHSRRGV